MKIGLINIFPSRPYFHHLIYFRNALEKQGYETNTFFCEGGNLSCYYKKQHSGIPDAIICSQCKLRRISAKDKRFAITGYKHTANDNYDQIPNDLNKTFRYICLNTFSTIHRIEELQDIGLHYSEENLKSDIKSLYKFYVAIRLWIAESNLKKVILFNGRMDLLAVVRLACKDFNIDYFCYEGTFFGRGLSLFKNNSCLSLEHWKNAHLKYIDKPLKDYQSKTALKVLQDRLNRDTELEWRSYFEKTDISYEDNLNSKALVLLSSTNEVSGALDFKTGWKNYLDGIDEIIEILGIDSNDVIVRGHPVWATKICGIGGKSIENLYFSWAKRRKYRYILSSSNLDTQYLIKNADNVIINYSSAFFEAAYYNKKIILTHSGYYDFSGIALKVDEPQKLSQIESFVNSFDLEVNKIRRYRKLLRFTYLVSNRLPVFINELKPNTKLFWNYSTNFNIISEKIVSFLNNGEYPYSDTNFNENDSDEEISSIKNIINDEKCVLDNTLSDSGSQLEPIDFFITDKKSKLIIKLEKLIGKGDYLGF